MKQPVYFLKFYENEIFADPQLNIFFNQLYTFMMNALSEDDVLEEFLIDGDVSLILQDSLVAKSSVDIKFSTSSKKIFTLLKSSMSSLPVSEFIISENDIRLRFSNKLITIVYSYENMSRVDFKGIGLRNKTEIIK